jgi:RNA polymerase sigma factor (sigma-70 family)
MGHSNLSHQELITRCIAGDEAAWSEFLKRFNKPIAAVLVKTLRRRMQPRPSLVDDLVQNTLLKLLENDCKALKVFKSQHENAIFGYLQVVSSNVAQDYLRRLEAKKRDARAEQELEEVPPDMVADDHGARDAEHRAHINQVEARLKPLASEKEQEIFWLYNRWGLTAREIAQLFQMNIKTVENMLAKLLRLLKEDFGKGTSSG